MTDKDALSNMEIIKSGADVIGMKTTKRKRGSLLAGCGSVHLKPKGSRAGDSEFQASLVYYREALS